MDADASFSELVAEFSDWAAIRTTLWRLQERLYPRRVPVGTSEHEVFHEREKKLTELINCAEPQFVAMVNLLAERTYSADEVVKLMEVIAPMRDACDPKWAWFTNQLNRIIDKLAATS